jgi:serine/threonine protein kinase
VSASNLTARTEAQIIKAFSAIHSLGVIHGDIREENILISENGDAAWIIDFEFTEIVNVKDDVKMAEMFHETQAVEDLLRELKDRHLYSHHDLPRRNGVTFITTQGEMH